MDAIGRLSAGETPEPQQTTPAHAVGAVRTTDKLAQMVHKDVSRYGSASFQRFWTRFYNGWLTYRTLHADRLPRTDPARVVEVDLPKYVRSLYEWRDALARERGVAGAPTATQGQAAQPQATRASQWRLVAVVGGVALAGWIFKSWWMSRQKQRDEESAQLMEAERAKVIAAAGAVAAPNLLPAPQAAPTVVIASPAYHAPYAPPPAYAPPAPSPRRAYYDEPDDEVG